MTADETADALRIKVATMSRLLHERDPAIVDELWSPGFRLVGSEAGEIAASPAELDRLFKMLFARPVRHAFDFSRFDVEQQGNIAWLFAEGHLVMTGEAEVSRCPYRLTAVFQQTGSGWIWRLFSGAEPAAPVGHGSD